MVGFVGGWTIAGCGACEPDVAVDAVDVVDVGETSTILQAGLRITSRGSGGTGDCESRWSWEPQGGISGAEQA